MPSVEPLESPTAVVPVARVSRSAIASKTVLTAEFQPFQEVDVMAKVAGYVRTIHVDLGDRVREGQVLAELEIPEMTNEVSKATAIVEARPNPRSPPRAMSCSAPNRPTRSRTSPTRVCRKSPKREAGLIPQQELDEVRIRAT